MIINYLSGILANYCYQWMNNKIGQFEYSQEYSYYRFVETTDQPYCWIVREQDRNDENTPIVINGFIAFLIACWRQDEVAIYNTYNERKKKSFIDIQAKKPGSFKRDLENEFAEQLLDTEQNNIEEFKKIFDYISTEEKSLVLEYAQNYLEYTSSIYKQKPLKTEKKETQFIDLLIPENKKQVLSILHSLLDSTTNKKGFAIAILALQQQGVYIIIEKGSNFYLKSIPLKEGF